MKKLLAIGCALCMASASLAQTINWESLQPGQKNIISANTGLDYATTFGLAYGRQVKVKQFPIVLQAEISIPAGEDLVDDFKSKLGGQVQVYKTKNFSATVLIYGLFRGQQTDLVKLQSFGSEFTGVVGYYRSKWFAAGEFGFDKAIATHIKNRELLKQIYPDARDGWYVPTGGNFHFGIQGGYTIKTIDLYVKAGKTEAQSWNTSATVPFYFQLGVNKRF